MNEELRERRLVREVQDKEILIKSTVMHCIFVHCMFPSIGISDELDETIMNETFGAVARIIIY